MATTKSKKDKVIDALKFGGFGFIEPLIRLFSGEEPKKNARLAANKILLPIVALLLFLFLWSAGASGLYQMEYNYKLEQARESGGDEGEKQEIENIKTGATDISTLPPPGKVWTATGKLWDDFVTVRKNKAAFKKKVAKINEKRAAQGKSPITYTGRVSFWDQIQTSIWTVICGFLLALVLAVPIGILLGLSKTLRSMFTWLIQIFKPVSPVVWLLLVSMVVNTIIKNPELDKAFIISFISVGLCAMWATLVNTTVGVASVDKDYINVARVLKLGNGKKIFKVVLPASIPMIFTGLRITISVAWMVLIAIELLAQSPGLGTFVWEEFQNGSSESNAKIIVAMFVIGIIGFALDRCMAFLQEVVTSKKSFKDLLIMIVYLMIMFALIYFIFIKPAIYGVS